MVTENDIVALSRSDGVLTITMRRTRSRNAIDRAMATALSRAFDELDDEPDLRVGILAAEGPVFSAGTDLHEPTSPATERGGEYGLVRRRRVKPLIAAVDGPALGGGFELVLACDLVVASTDAAFSLPEVKRGVVPSCGGLFRAAGRLPSRVAAEMVLTGDPLGADRAREFGLVNVLCGPGRARQEAVDLARRITCNSPAAVAASLAALREVEAAVDTLGWSATSAAVDHVADHPERAEGIAAFFEKRPPAWQTATGTTPTGADPRRHDDEGALP